MTPQEENQLIKESSRGKQAEAWLKDPITLESFDTVRTGILEKWEASPLEDKEGQYALRLMLKLLDDVKRNVEHVAFTGKMAGEQLTAFQKAKQATKRFINEWGVRV